MEGWRDALNPTRRSFADKPLVEVPAATAVGSRAHRVRVPVLLLVRPPSGRWLPEASAQDALRSSLRSLSSECAAAAPARDWSAIVTIPDAHDTIDEDHRARVLDAAGATGSPVVGRS